MEVASIIPSASDLRILLLGPVEAVSNGDQIALGAPKQRAVLAMLALEAGSTVSAEHLIDGLWGDDPPATAGKLVQLYVSHIRKAMADCGQHEVIATHGRGYELQVGRDQVDVGHFERLLAQGAARDALAPWRGAPLADVAGEPFAAGEVRRLEELRIAAVGRRRRSTPTGWRGPRSSSRWASNRDRSCAGCRSRSCARIPGCWRANGWWTRRRARHWGARAGDWRRTTSPPPSWRCRRCASAKR